MKKITDYKFIARIAAIAAVAAPSAAAFADTSVTLPNPLTNCSGGTIMSCIVQPAINFIFVLAVPICVIMVLWGGFTLMTSEGNPEKVATGQKTILYAAVGFLVVLLANSVTGIIQHMFTGS